MKKIFVFTLGLASFACSKKDDKSNVNSSANNSISIDSVLASKPFGDDLFDFNTIQVDANKGADYTLPNGVKITVPDNAFVKANGEIVEGKVDIKVREFSNAAQIISAGIPLEYDSSGQTYNLMTNGMLEFRGFQNNESVEIAPEKTLKVSAEGIEDVSKFNFYQLNEKTNNWEFVSNGNKIAAESDKKDKKVKEINNEYKFRLDLNTSEFPELRAYKNIVWQYYPVKGAEDQDPNKNLWIEESEWDDVVLEPSEKGKLIYKLVFKSKSKQFSTTVMPVFSKEDRAIMEAKFDKKQAYSANRIMSFEMSKFGVYNSDVIYHMNNQQELLVNFTNSKTNVPENARVYMICKKSRGVVSYQNNQRIIYNPDMDFKFLVVLPDAQAGFVSKADFLKMVNSADKTQKVNAEIKVHTEKITTVAQFEKLIDNI